VDGAINVGCVDLHIRSVETDADYEAWRGVRIAVVPGERADTVAELRRDATAERLLTLAERDGIVVGSGSADRSETAGGGFVAIRVLPEYRRQGIGTVLLKTMSDHIASLGLPELRGSVEDPGSLAFTERAGFVERDRQIEQVRTIGEEPLPDPPAGLDIVTLDERPELWAACYERFGREALADFAVANPMVITAEQWETYWAGDPMFLALERGEVIGCAGLDRDADRPERGENALTAVRRDRRGRGIASYLKRRTLHWAAGNGITEVYTWTQRGNDDMRRLNIHLGYRYGQESITVARPV
jgi:mycothiol synthase